MAKRFLEPAPEFVNTLFGLAPAPLTPIWRKQLLVEKGATKFCTFCRADVSVAKFGTAKHTADKLQPHCNPCHNAQNRARYHRGTKGKKRVTDVHRLRTYNLTPDEYDQMLNSQKGKCAICSTELKPGRFTHIDHCHTSGRVREILCMKCNHVIGMIEKIPVELSAYYAYVKKHADRISEMSIIHEDVGNSA